MRRLVERVGVVGKVRGVWGGRLLVRIRGGVVVGWMVLGGDRLFVGMGVFEVVSLSVEAEMDYYRGV